MNDDQFVGNTFRTHEDALQPSLQEDLTRAIREAFGVTSTDSAPRFLEAIATSLGHGRFVSTSIPDALIEASLNIESGLSAVANAIEKLKP